MRHRLAVAVICVAVPAACATPDHSNVLIFATNTKVALDVSVSPTNAAPDVTLGYKRQEGVWMPLVPNTGPADMRMPKDCMKDISSCGFVGVEAMNRDTYSVLASFGAQFEGSTGQAQSSGKVGLAQFFATGLAARILAESGGARLVSITERDQITQMKIERAVASIPSVNAEANNEADPLVKRFRTLENTETPEAKAELEKFDAAATKAGYPRTPPSPSTTYPAFRDFASDDGKTVETVRLVRSELAALGVKLP